MPLREQITEDMKTAMKAREAEKLGAVRLILAAVKQREVDERITLDDPGVIAVIEKMIKQRKDSISQFEKAARQDLGAVANGEILKRQHILAAGRRIAEGQLHLPAGPRLGDAIVSQ